MFDEFNDDEFLKFDRVENKLSTRPDIHAFILLNELFPGTRDMVACANHDEIYLDVDAKELKEKATKEQLRDLHRCGVRADSDGICMFV
jgi:hypothetical protein